MKCEAAARHGHGSSLHIRSAYHGRAFGLAFKEHQPAERLTIAEQSGINDTIKEALLSVPALNVRNLSEKTHHALRVRAAKHGRSTEAEVRAILDEAVRPKSRPKLGSLLTEIGRRFGGIDLDIDRDPAPPTPAAFE